MLSRLFSILLIYSIPFIVSAQYQSDNWFPVTVNGKAGYIDRSGKIVLEPKYDGASYFSEGLARVSAGRDTIITAGFSQGFIDETGKLVIRPQWDVVSNFSEGLAAVGYDITKQEVKIGNKTFYTTASHPSFVWGFVDKTGQLVIDVKFHGVSEFKDGLAVASIPVMSEWKYGFIDSTGKWIIAPRFDYASQFSEGLALVFNNKNKRYGYIDKTGNQIIPFKFTYAREFSEGVACVQIGGDVVKPFGMSAIRNQGRFVFIDEVGNTVIKLKNSRCRSFSEGLASFEEFGKYGEGFIDHTGKVVIQPFGGGQSEFSEGLKFVILDNGKLGFIDRTGTVVLQTPFGKIDDFYRGLAEVCESYDFGSKCGYIEKTGKLIWPLTN
jgi:hypothetical protein